MLLGGLAILAVPAGAQGQPKQGGTLVMAMDTEPPTLAGYTSTAQPVGEISTKVYEGLLDYSPDLKPMPSLAKSWTVSDGGKTITFKLQEGVKWHDGQPFTSADVQYTIMEVLKKLHPRGINTFHDLESIDTPDEHTAVFHLARPAPYMMMALSAYESPIIPKHLFAGTDLATNPYANKPVGTGPFKFIEWKKGQYIRLDRNPGYWKPGLPHLDRIVARMITDPGTRSAAMETGEINYAAFSAIPNVDLDRLKKLPDIAVTTDGYAMQSPILQLDLNTSRKPFDDVRVRQAIAYSIDRKFIADKIWFGYARVATGPINSAFKANGFYTTEGVKNYDVPNGVEIANKMLDEAGYKRGADGNRFQTTLEVGPGGPDYQRYAEYLQQALGKIGIKVVLRNEDWPTWLRRIYTNYDFDMSCVSIQTLADPVIGIDRLYSSWSIKPGTIFVNDTHWSSPKTDELMRAAGIETDPKKRAEIYHEFQRVLSEQVPLIWVDELEFVTVYNKKLKNLFVSALGAYSSFDQAWIDK
ncbi:MAG TPA: ABC transporter substrate-binding protein [Reyranella sp.]|nr:ABC transporter substrate-binding protein [Reyranella sp.]